MNCRLLGCVVLVTAAAACERPGPGAGPADAPAPVAGSWTAELRLEHSLQLPADAAAGRTVRGEVVLLERGRTERLPRAATHYGSHTVDVRPFGIALGGGERVPTVVAWATGDSLRLTLNPDAPGGGIDLDGRLAGDSAAGRWWWHGPGRSSPSASGHFVLRRRSGQAG